MYRSRERVVKWDRYKGGGSWTIGHRIFRYPQTADIYAYCFRHYGADVANAVDANLTGKLETTYTKFARDKLVEKAKSNFMDWMLGRLGVPQLPTPVGLAKDILEAAGDVLGALYIQEAVNANKAARNYTANYLPSKDQEVYCMWVIYSWVIDPENGPYYGTYLPGSIRH